MSSQAQRACQAPHVSPSHLTNGLAWQDLCAIGDDTKPPVQCDAHVGKRRRTSYAACVATIARAYRYWVALACALLCWWAPAYVWASLSHITAFPFPDRAQHAAQQDGTAKPSGHDLTCNPTPTRRVGARDVGKAAAARRWVGASPTRPSERVKAEYGKGGRLLKKREWSYEYDARGRRTAKIRTLGDLVERTEYDWDGRDKLRTIRKPDGTRLDYSYDAFGRRVSKTRSGGPLDGKRVEFLWDGEVLAWELDTERGPRAFVHEPGGFEPVLQQQGGETYLCVNDHLGMPKELIDGSGRLAWAASHSAYGKVIATEGPPELEVEGGFVSGGEPRVESPFRLLGQVNDDDAELAWTRFRCSTPTRGLGFRRIRWESTVG